MRFHFYLTLIDVLRKVDVEIAQAPEELLDGLACVRVFGQNLLLQCLPSSSVVLHGYYDQFLDVESHI